MRTVRRLLAALGVILTIGPALAYLGGGPTLPQVKGAMLAGTVLWFAAVLLPPPGQPRRPR